MRIAYYQHGYVLCQDVVNTSAYYSDCCVLYEEKVYIMMSEYVTMQKKKVMYPHLSSGNRLFGGQLVAWFDECAAIFAQDIMNGADDIVTKVINTIEFNHPIMLLLIPLENFSANPFFQ